MIITDWDDAYANGPHIPGGAEFPARWMKRAADFRASLPAGTVAEIGAPWGTGARQTVDIFRPAGTVNGLAIFVHGGYWRAFDPSVWSHLAAGALARGWMIALPSYTLAPAARIRDIAGEIARSIAFCAERSDGPIRLAGHSAGGHLVTRMLCTDELLSAGIAARIRRTVSISGVHDLRPLMGTAINLDLRMDDDECNSESPALLVPRPGIRCTCWVGSAERPEFIRQNDLLANIWTGLGADMTAVHDDGRHHFDVVDGLENPDSPLCRAWLD